MSKPVQSTTMEQEAVMSELYRKFIAACHILHKHEVVDAYGHLSVRHPYKPDVFIMSQYVAPGTVSSRDDLIEYWVEDASPVDPNAKPGYSERCIHSEILKAYSYLQAVVHSHTEAVTPYSFSGVPLRACTHMAGFLGGEAVPVWDIQSAYHEDDVQNMLVSNTRLGKSLAKSFSTNTDKADVSDKTVVLMRGHGLTVVAERIEDVVARCIYTLNNAKMQTSALLTQNAYLATSSQDETNQTGGLAFLSSREAKDAGSMNQNTVLRPWKLWCREVEADPLYVNYG